MSSLLTVYLSIVNAAYAIITIEVSSKFVELDRTNLKISCLVSDNSLNSLDVIQLTREGTNIVSATMDGKVFWQDKMLETRSDCNASLINVLASCLNLTIPKTNVIKGDMGVYRCELSAEKRDSSLYLDKSGEIFINITEKYTKDTNGVSGSTASRSTLREITVLMKDWKNQHLLEIVMRKIC
uniref:Uncharacterized protein LOC111105801 isoform X2 n=1 Tax=Crassostrea virginica TaxID=6565 RepID=A0A8B8AXG4_CRAVI|nr:uncharacterized protein LOC111105801 isoform X2 [Crassostrea virginica]